jgi:hypothetical protein
VVVHVGAHFAQIGDLRGLNLFEGFQIGLPHEQAPAGEHLVEQDARREDVDAMIDSLPQRDLGREVAKLALHDVFVFGLQVGAGLGQPEIHQFDFTEARHQHVVRRDITMNDMQRVTVVVTCLVGVRQPFADLHGDEAGNLDAHHLLLPGKVIENPL